MRKIGKVFFNIIMSFIVICCIISLGACTKDKIIDSYNNTLQAFSKIGLTSSRRLQGRRKFSDDTYVGTYKAKYESYTGVEYLFGGTALERNNGNNIVINCTLTNESGNAKLFFKSGSEEKQILLENDGEYSEEIELPAASNYIGIECDNFKGSIDINIE